MHYLRNTTYCDPKIYFTHLLRISKLFIDPKASISINKCHVQFPIYPFLTFFLKIPDALVFLQIIIVNLTSLELQMLHRHSLQRHSLVYCYPTLKTQIKKQQSLQNFLSSYSLTENNPLFCSIFKYKRNPTNAHWSFKLVS